MRDTASPRNPTFSSAKVEIVRLIDGRAYRRTLAWGLVGAGEAADYLGVTPRTIWNLVARGRLHPIRHTRSRRVHFRIGELKTLALPRPTQHQEDKHNGKPQPT
jgi:excisionase family DNA binding protein